MKKKSVSFSYLDGFFLLLAALILSMGIYVGIEENKKIHQQLHYRVAMQTQPPEYLWENLPVAGETVYDREGNTIGTVLTASFSEEESLLALECELIDTAPTPGEEFRLETRGCILSLQVKDVAVIENTK